VRRTYIPKAKCAEVVVVASLAKQVGAQVDAPGLADLPTVERHEGPEHVGNAGDDA